MKLVSPIVRGKCGGTMGTAQGRGTHIDSILDAINKAKEIANEKFN